MGRFTVTDLPLIGLKRVERQHLGDERGFLSRLFCADELSAAGWSKPIAQINHTHSSSAGIVRGLHFQQPPHAEMKLVTCIRGEIWDVAVDLRKNSKTFLNWHAERLSAKNGYSLLIPEGFAHGFQTLTDDVDLLYCHSVAHVSAADAGLNPKDPMLAIPWPLPIAKLSARDAQHPLLNKEYSGVTP